MNLSRREFLIRSACLGTLALFPAARLRAAGPAQPTESAAAAADLAAVTGPDPFLNTERAVAALGGIRRFVAPGTRVALLINAPRWWTKPGSFVSPSVALAAVKLCADAGAREVALVVEPPSGYWARSPRAGDCGRELALVKSSGREWREVAIPQGRSLKHAEMNRVFLDSEVVINVSIAKHHAGTGFSACLKNTMGACSSSTNRFFHEGSGASSEYGDVDFLSQCIADVNLVRKPALCLCDATEYLRTNGPAGPGELGRSRAVVAGSDIVAVDAYCSQTFHQLRPERVTMIQRAFEHGIGQIDWTKLKHAHEQLPG